MRFRKQGLAVFAAATILTMPAFADQTKTEAVIVSVSDSRIDARTVDGPVTIVLGSGTTIKETSGVVRKKTRDTKSLIPGLIFTVEGERQGDTITAKTIHFKESDRRAAVTTKAGTSAQFAELRRAIIDGQEYVIRGESVVYFASGSATVGAQYKQELRALAQQAPSYGNYRISVLGFADPRGDAEANQRLSARRAGAVSSYLRQTGSIEPARVLSPSAMGEGTTAPGEAVPTSADEARRVVVRIVTPKGQLAQ